MRETIISSFKQLGENRTTRTLYAVMVLLCGIAAVYFALRIRISDILVTAHYTSFGGVNFYVTEWWYTIGFVLFFLLIAIAHTAIGMKLVALKGATTANGFAYLTIAVLVLATIMLIHTTNVAFPL